MIDYNTFFTNKTILITGGSGSFGQAFIRKILSTSKPKKVIVFSRDEWKHSEMQDADPVFRKSNLRYFLGDIRDKERLYLAFRDVDYIIHAAALKQVPAAEYNPTEFIKTNIIGTMNVMDVAISSNVKKVIALSTDKAAAPINLYGATKLCADKLILSGKSYVGDRGEPKLSVVRYGNVLGSKGSLLPRWKKMIQDGVESLPVTDERMTRFWITMDQAAEFVMQSLVIMQGEEIFVPKLPSMKITDLAQAMAPHLPIKNCGIRPGEKLHEHLITQGEAKCTFEYPNHYVVRSHRSKIEEGQKVESNFEYSSNGNSQWLESDTLQKTLLMLT
ncbi:MAG: UDP-N-acetylglucosamine 4,6-dehydratase (inverting) [Chlamydiae bacterium]|nr:UDP-N-acetylglucosamine 4,6-dehydratase (inverting) [Chlamydiota bacterium]